MRCEHDLRGVCWLCDWATQPWWPEARLEALRSGRLTWSELELWLRWRMQDYDRARPVGA